MKTDRIQKIYHHNETVEAQKLRQKPNGSSSFILYVFTMFLPLFAQTLYILQAVSSSLHNDWKYNS